MIYRKLGNTGIEVSALGFGAMRLPMTRIGTKDFVDYEKAIECIQLGFEKGINYIDTGFLYCSEESEIAVGRALRGWRDKVTVTSKATKFHMKSPGDLRRMLEHQLVKLDIDYFDFYCFHGIGWDNFHELDRATGWKKDLFAAKAQGLVKRIAFSFHDKPESMPRLIDLGLFEMVTCQYNYLDRSNEDAIQYANEKGLGVIVMGPVGGGRLVGLPEPIREKVGVRAQFSAELPLKFVLSNPNVHVALSGMGSRQMVEENCAVAASGQTLSDEEYEKLKALLDETKEMANLYCTGCGYCMPCEHGVDIPRRFELMNYSRLYGLKDYAKVEYAKLRQQEAKSEGKGDCVECKECLEKCPQNIAIIEQLQQTESALGAVKVP